MKAKVQTTRILRKSVLIATIVFCLYFLITLLLQSINSVDKKTTKIQNYQTVADFFLGLKKPVNILILFENNAEIRPGGGFIGTVGQIKVENGKASPQPIRSVYYFDHKSSETPHYYEEPLPDGSGGMMPYNLRDSGQNLDWPTDAQRAINIFQKESDSQVDGVIGVTPALLQTLLRWTGPIYLEDYKKTVTADNLQQTVQLEVESGQDKSDRKDPKTILSSVANSLVSRLATQTIADYQKNLPELIDLFRQRKIVLFSKDQEVNKALEQLKFDGSIVPQSIDYLMLAQNNIGGDKSTPYIAHDTKRNIKVSQDGSISEKLEIKRTHTSDYQSPYVDAVTGLGTWIVQKNKTELLIALPAGTKLKSESPNVELKLKGKEKGYDVYAFVSELDPLSSQTYNLSYELPFKLSLGKVVTYNTYQQFQIGGFPLNNSLSIRMPSGYQLQASNKQNLTTDSSGQVVYNNTITQDEFGSFVYEKQQ